MTEQQQEKTGQAPDAARKPQAPVPAEPQDPSTRAAQLQEELDGIRATSYRGGARVMLRVLPPHDSFSCGGVTVGREPTPVPAHAVARLAAAAAEAGVTLEEA